MQIVRESPIPSENLSIKFSSERKRDVPHDYLPPPLEPEPDPDDELIAVITAMDIVVKEPKHIQRIYSMGNFGTFVGQRSNFANLRCFGQPSNSASDTCIEDDKISTNISSGNPNECDYSPKAKKKIAECNASKWLKKCEEGHALLHLSPWEAFYLLNDLQLLKIICDSIPKTTTKDQLFEHFKSIFGFSFVRRYLVYRYFRQIGWILRDGLNFGVDFLLYKDSVELHHSAAGVRILESMADPVVTDPAINAIQRELANCKKRLLLAAVEFLLPEDKLQLNELELAKVHVLSLDPWNANRSRISDFD